MSVAPPSSLASNIPWPSYSAYGGDAPAPVKEMLLSFKVTCLHDGTEGYFKMLRTTSFKNLMQSFCEDNNLDVIDCRFYYAGTKVTILPSDTPDALGMDNGIEIDAKFRPSYEGMQARSSTIQSADLMKWYCKNF